MHHRRIIMVLLFLILGLSFAAEADMDESKETDIISMLLQSLLDSLKNLQLVGSFYANFTLELMQADPNLNQEIVTNVEGPTVTISPTTTEKQTEEGDSFKGSQEEVTDLPTTNSTTTVPPEEVTDSPTTNATTPEEQTGEGGSPIVPPEKVTNSPTTNANTTEKETEEGGSSIVFSEEVTDSPTPTTSTKAKPNEEMPTVNSSPVLIPPSAEERTEEVSPVISAPIWVPKYAMGKWAE